MVGKTIDEFKVLLAEWEAEGNPLTVIYELTEPIPITPTLPLITTTEGVCEISSTNAVKPVLEIKYLEK